MIPLRDDNPTRQRAIVVPIFVAINAFVYFFIQPSFGSPAEQATFFACTASVPYEVTHGEPISQAPEAVDSDIGAVMVQAQRQNCPNKNVWLAILYSMFMHGSLLHIGGNMLYLWVFGNNVEDTLGRVRFILFYLIAGLVATYAQAVLDPTSQVPLIGASGAIAGILGAYLMLFPKARITTLVPIFFFLTTMHLPALVVLGFWFVLQLFQSVGAQAAAGGVAYMAHVGGFVAGMVMLLIIRPKRPQARPRYEGWG